MRCVALCALAVASLSLHVARGDNNSNALGSMAGSLEHISHAVALEIEGSDEEGGDALGSPLTHMEDALTAGGSEEMWGQSSFFAAPNGGLPLDDTAESAMEGLPDESVQNAASVRREPDPSSSRPSRPRSPFDRRPLQNSASLKPQETPAVPPQGPGSFSSGSPPFAQTLGGDSLERAEASSRMSDTLEHAKQGPGTSGSSIFEKTAGSIDVAVLSPKRAQQLHWKVAIAVFVLSVTLLAVILGSQSVSPIVRFPSVTFSDVDDA